MPKAILDTSSLITLGLAERTEKIPSGETRGFYHTFGGIDQAIEALILYDEVYIDAPSIERNLDGLPELQNYTQWCQRVAEKKGIEGAVYQSIITDCIPHIEEYPQRFPCLLRRYVIQEDDFYR